MRHSELGSAKSPTIVRQLQHRKVFSCFYGVEKAFSVLKGVFQAVILEGEPILSATGALQNGYPEAGEKI
jgi:hypothetical protein